MLSADLLHGPAATELSGERLTDAMVRAVTYADVFESPLTMEEMFRYLEVGGLSRQSVADAAMLASESGGKLSRNGNLFALPGREEVFVIRRRRAQIAAEVWPRARFWGQLIAAIPYVRMVAITGSLAAENVEPDADIDFLIVTEPGHLWTARAAAVSVCRLARRRGVQLCPNYLVTATSLRLGPENLYGAHEFAQMTVIHGAATAGALARENAWARAFLPNASLRIAVDGRPSAMLEALKSLGERLLGGRRGASLERWAWRRKANQVSGDRIGDEERYAPDLCKGHQHHHAERTMVAFTRRLETLSTLPTSRMVDTPIDHQPWNSSHAPA